MASQYPLKGKSNDKIKVGKDKIMNSFYKIWGIIFVLDILFGASGFFIRAPSDAFLTAGAGVLLLSSIIGLVMLLLLIVVWLSVKLKDANTPTNTQQVDNKQTSVKRIIYMAFIGILIFFGLYLFTDGFSF